MSIPLAYGLDWRAQCGLSHMSDTLVGRLESRAHLGWFSRASSCGLSSIMVSGGSNCLHGG